MNFDKNSLRKLLQLSDTELEAVINEIAREAGIEEKIKVGKSDVARVRAFLSIATEEDIAKLLQSMGGRKK